VRGIAIVTGAANGIGRAVALRLAPAGYLIVLVDLEKDKAESVKAEIAALGGEAETYGVDATNAQQLKSAVAAVMRRHGRIDALVNVAGGTVYLKRVEELERMERRSGQKPENDFSFLP
jgi:3-oxoacyl-[acyl-carrier protein] reductase